MRRYLYYARTNFTKYYKHLFILLAIVFAMRNYLPKSLAVRKSDLLMFQRKRVSFYLNKIETLKAELLDEDLCHTKSRPVTL